MLVISIILILYCLLMLWLILGFDKVKKTSLSDSEVKTSFSVIIPFRNEARNLPFLLTSIQELNYPQKLVEFIFVDDDSSDDSVNIINEYLQQSVFRIVQNIRISNSPKKDAIQTAIQQATHEWIITTDADCILPKDWLASFNAFIQENNTVLIAGPVIYKSENSFLETLQKIEFHTLQAVTIGSFGINKPMMCNGANLAYKKAAFLVVRGFEGNNSLASGDDVFLLEKIHQQYKNKVHFLRSKTAMVTTLPQKTWSSFIEQRVRWASKSTHYQNLFTKLAGMIVLLGNLALVIISFLTLFQFFSPLLLLAFFFVKIIVDLFLLLKFERSFSKNLSLKTYLTGGIIYPFITMYIMILTIFSGYTWKGRYFKQ